LVRLDHELDFRDLDWVPVAVRDLMLEVTQPVAMPLALFRMLMLEGFFQSMPVAGAASRALGPVGHDDVRVTVRVLAVRTVRTVRMLDHLDKPMDMRIGVKVMAVNVFVVVPVRHSPMLAVHEH
jgi:hypothetical protein